MPRSIMMFCGQGAQYYQMGRELHQSHAVFRRAMDRCDEVAGDLGGRTVSALIYGRPLSQSENFDCLAESNPALLAVSYALAVTLLEGGVSPERLLGYSLGETIAAVVGGVLSLEEGFRLVQGQAGLFQQFAPPGAMVAVLADPARVRQDAELATFCEFAAINSPVHCVLSLLARDLPAVCAALDRRGLAWARLPIRYPFHAAPIDPLALPMQRLSATVRFAPPRLPIISANTGGVVERFDGAHLWQVTRGQLRFRATIEALAREGEFVLVEAGPSGTLAAFARQVAAPGITAWPSIDQFGQNARTLRQLLAAAT